MVDSTGKQKSRFFITEKETKAFLREVNADANKLKTLLDTGVSFSAFSAIFLEEKSKQDLKPTAYKAADRVDCENEYVGRVLLRDIDSVLVQQMIYDLAKQGYSESIMTKAKQAVGAGCLLCGHSLVIYEDVDCCKEYYCYGDASVKGKNNGKLIQNHAKQASGEGDHNQSQQQPTLYTQFLAVKNSVDDAQQKKQQRCHFVNMDTGERDHDGHNEVDKQCDIQDLLHAAATSAAGIVLTPKIK